MIRHACVGGSCLQKLTSLADLRAVGEPGVTGRTTSPLDAQILFGWTGSSMRPLVWYQ